MGKVIMSGVSKGMTVPITVLENFSDNTWEQIIVACERNTIPATWTVGDQKAMTINGKDYLIDIIGKNHDEYPDGGKAPLTFKLHDCYDTQCAINSSKTNVGGWSECDMRTKHLPAIFSLMPNEVQDGIKRVSKHTSLGNQNSSIGVTEDTLFLLSEVEVLNTTSNSYAGEGEQYEYYSSGNISNESGYWHGRSPIRNTTAFCGFMGRASGTYTVNADTELRVSFAFCF